MINAGDGNDVLVGAAGDDTIIAGSGNDKIDGGAGIDRLVAGLGNDTLNGGADADTFVLGLDLTHLKTVTDFKSATLDKLVFTDSLTPIALNSAHFVTAATSTFTFSTAEPSFAYNTKTGALFYDADGFMYKQNYWMASGKAVLLRNSKLSEFEQAKKALFQEWISTSKIYLREWYKSVWDVVDKFTTGLRSSLTYVGAKNLEDFYNKVTIGVQTPAGFHEGTPHGKVKK